ncbi:MAG: DUF1990 domain-containing protein [Acidimicrobiia bacterium]|nr:DUF1990 domain-containing protein [Acidimicrobiia bacterium]
MFCLRRPSCLEIEAFLASQQESPFSYAEVGATRGKLPTGYAIDRNRVKLGAGPEAFCHAVQALRHWQMFQLGWLELFDSNTAIRAGATVAVLARHFGFWSLNSSRVVYVFNDDRSYGFAYGTLRDHAEQGEERFSVDWSSEDDSVSYDILAFSRPQQWQAKVARPVSRLLQKKFARDSKAAMIRVVLERAAGGGCV